jgi:hypothetical protein
MLLRLTVALLLLLGVVMYGIGDGPDLDRTALAELRAEEQRALAPQVSRRTQSVLNVAVAAPAADPVVVPEPVATPDPVVASLGATQRPEVTEPVAEPVDDAIVLYVTGRRVNLRAGPSTGAAVVGSVVRGQEVRLVDFEANGWAQIRVTDLDQPVFMSGDFLSDSR